MSEHLVPEEYEHLGTGAPQFEHDGTDGVAAGVSAVRARLQVALDGLGLHGAQAAGFQRVEEELLVLEEQVQAQELHLQRLQDQVRKHMLQRDTQAVQNDEAAGHPCQMGRPDGVTCNEPAEVKLTDSWGDTAWSCLDHAGEALLGARGVFIATKDADGLTPYLARKWRPDGGLHVDGA